MNAVLIAVAVMLLLSLLRVQVIVAIIVGALTGGLIGGLGISETISTFTAGLGNSAPIALATQCSVDLLFPFQKQDFLMQ